jgi:ribosomal protein L11 methyltransferase
MSWISAVLTVHADCVEALSDVLLSAGALSVEVTDAEAGTPREVARFGEPGEPGVPRWEYARISVLFDEKKDCAAAIAAALEEVGLAPNHPYTLDRVADQDWVLASRSQFQPVKISPLLWVVPSWHTPPDPAAVNLSIDPGLAFGTGAHPTTHLCLQWLEASVHGGESVLDYGCGSGILAIAAMKFGAARATGIDIDAAALLAARHNAMQNQVVVNFESADQAAGAAYDIVIANILANPLKLLAPLLARVTRSRGRIALSGILERQSEEINGLYGEWFEMNAARHYEGWALLTGTRY